jgi:uncharacterized protein YecE (DUF72 family)
MEDVYRTQRRMEIRTGTSGFSYKEWKGAFYPQDLPADRMLAYYGERFRACEINNTFYRMPDPEMLRGWASEVPPSFRFVLKASRQITHSKRLKDCAQPVEFLAQQARALGEQLGPILFQLPPNLKADVERLRTFLGVIPSDIRAALEFRHESWHDDAVLDALREHGAALAIADTDELTAPRVATAEWGYLRLRRVVYTDDEVRDWASWTLAQNWSEAYAFFKHEDAATGPRLAARFAELCQVTA